MLWGLQMSKKRHFEYEIQYTKAADKFLKEHEEIRNEYEAAIKELLIGDHPEKIDVKRIKGKRNDYYRIRLGNCRVVYAIINGRIIVIKTLLAGSRGDVYKKMSGLKKSKSIKREKHFGRANETDCSEVSAVRR